MGALPHFGAPQGDILLKKTENDFFSRTDGPIELKFGVEYQSN